MKKKRIKKIEKWFAVQLADLVLCGEVYSKEGPEEIQTGALWGLKGEYAVCKDGIYKLGKVDRVWIKTNDADILDQYELKD